MKKVNGLVSFNLKQSILRYKYIHSKPIYIVACWARWGVRIAQYSGKCDKNGDPLTIQYSDHNGEYESYFIAPWYYETTGTTIAYFFNLQEAEALAEKLNKGDSYIWKKNI